MGDGENLIVGHAICTLSSLLTPEGIVEDIGRSLLLALLTVIKLCHLHLAKFKFTVGGIELVSANTLIAVIESICEWVTASL